MLGDILVNKSLATKDSNTLELYENRKIYKDHIFMSDDSHGPEHAHIRYAFADFWYDRFLYGKVNRAGDIIIPREGFLSTLQTKTDKTYYALDFVAVAFNEFRSYFERHTTTNIIPNKKTLFASINPVSAWQSVYDQYHEYISAIYEIFTDHITEVRGHDKINNFEDFVSEFFIFSRNIIVKKASSPITLSGFVTNRQLDAKCGGLTIDLFKARASNDLSKQDLFGEDVNFNFYIDAVNKHGFVIDKNVPWRLHANLSSEYMKMLMESEAFAVKYDLGIDHIFDNYYLKTYTMDIVLLRKYLYDMYTSMLNAMPAYTKERYCNRTQKIITELTERSSLTIHDREKKYNVKSFWLNAYLRFRLLELQNDLLEADKLNLVNKAKSVYDIRGEKAAIKFIHKETKKYFIDNYNKARRTIQPFAPKHH